MDQLKYDPTGHVTQKEVQINNSEPTILKDSNGDNSKFPLNSLGVLDKLKNENSNSIRCKRRTHFHIGIIFLIILM